MGVKRKAADEAAAAAARKITRSQLNYGVNQRPACEDDDEISMYMYGNSDICHVLLLYIPLSCDAKALLCNMYATTES